MICSSPLQRLAGRLLVSAGLAVGAGSLGVPVAVAGENMGGDGMDPRTSPTLPLKRDPEIAIREEFDLAVAAGTGEALAVFVARHAGHPLAVEAQRRIDAARGRPSPR
ncbi:MAG: hypothetical protein U1E56_09460 [Bauldia sp.]